MTEHLDFDDILIIPETYSDVDHRKDVYPYDKNGFLPIFTAPMFDVVGVNSIDYYKENKIYSIIPRTKRLNVKNNISYDKFVWQAYGLNEFKEIFLDSDITLKDKAYALIDIANGHMKSMINMIRDAKEKHGENLVIMAGNVANPETIKFYDWAGCDYVRLSIGSGSGCLTTEQSAIGYPLASLIINSRKVKLDYNLNVKLVLDGGLRKYSDSVKALALGADYVMLGSALNKTLESEAPACDVNNEFIQTIPKSEVDKRNLVKSTEIYKKYRGMSTKSAQLEMGLTKLKTSEGVTRINNVENTLNGWCENFIHYLRNAMSYTNSFNLIDFKDCQWIRVSANAYNRYHK